MGNCSYGSGMSMFNKINIDNRIFKMLVIFTVHPVTAPAKTIFLKNLCNLTILLDHITCIFSFAFLWITTLIDSSVCRSKLFMAVNVWVDSWVDVDRKPVRMIGKSVRSGNRAVIECRGVIGCH